MGNKNLRIAWDLDGVLCDIDNALLRITHMMSPEEEEAVAKYYYSNRTPLLNPKLFLADGDEWFVITARGVGWMEDMTRRWLDKFYPGYNGLYFVGGDGWNAEPYNGDFYKWNDICTLEKVTLIKDLKIDVYFEDNPRNVMKYRELLDIPIIQYGTRI